MPESDVPESFDPYYQWLGIPPEEQPANHYRLLGIKWFEDNIDVIAAADDSGGSARAGRLAREHAVVAVRGGVLLSTARGYRLAHMPHAGECGVPRRAVSV